MRDMYSRLDSNQRPPHPKCRTLPTVLLLYGKKGFYEMQSSMKDLLYYLTDITLSQLS